MNDQDTGQRRSIDLIMVEDTAVDIELIADALREAGLELEVRRVDEEPSYCAALDERLPDAILADWTLPNFSGRRALEIARERCPEIPFIFVSGTISETFAIDALHKGAIDYVYKHQLQLLAPVLIRAVDEARAQLLLRKSEERHRQLFNNSRDALMTVAPPSWKFTGANQATLQIFGASSVAEFTALGPWDVSPEWQPDGRSSSEKVQEMIAIAMRDGSHFFEWEHQRLDGQPFAADVLLTRMGEGEDMFLHATVRDITERKRAETIRTQLAAIVESSNDAIIGKTNEGIIVSWNKSAEAIYGYSADEIIGKPITILAPLSRHAEINELLEEVHKGGTVVNHESERVRKDGALIHVELTMSPIRDASGNITGTSTIARDITERKQAETKLNEQVEELRRWHEATLGMGLRNIELKYEVNELLVKAGQPARYPSAEQSNSE